MSEYDAEFEALGEPEVRHRLVAKQGLHVTRWPAAESWLALQESERVLRADDSSSKRDAREEETLAIAKEANAIARSQSAAAWRAARYAMYAAIIATIAAVISLVKT